MAILTSADYPAIRAALDTDLGTRELPDATIAMEIYHPAAEQDVIRRVPDAESKTGEDAKRVKRAAILFCAARLAGAVIRKTSLSIQTRDMNYSRPAYDAEKKAAELRALAEEQIGLLEADDTPNLPTMFTVASGTRGK